MLMLSVISLCFSEEWKDRLSLREAEIAAFSKDRPRKRDALPVLIDILESSYF